MNRRDPRMWLWATMATALLTAVLATSWGISQRDDDSGFFENDEALRLLKQENAASESEVLRARMGLAHDYDLLVASLGRSAALAGALRGRIESRNDARAAVPAHGLADDVRRLAALEAERQGLVEQFKSSNSVFHDSLAFLPTAQDELQSALHDAAAARAAPVADVRALSACASRLLLAVLLQTQARTTERTLLVDEDLASIDALPAARLPGVAPRARIFANHVRAVVREQARVDALAEAIAAFPTPALIDRIDVAIDAEQAQVTQRRKLVRIGLFTFGAVVLILFLGAATALVRSHAEIRRVNRELRHANEHLEQRVDERTAELHQAQGQVAIAARRAGMAEIATNVLHNVGNVLNGVNVSAAVIVEQLRLSRVHRIAQALGLLEAHAGDLADYLANDAQGRLLPAYLAQASSALEDQHRELARESGELARRVDHIKEIVAAQQDYAIGSRVLETVSVDELLDEALRMNAALLAQAGVVVSRRYAALGQVALDRVRTLQIVMNLVVNAAQAMARVTGRERRLVMGIEPAGPGCLCISVADSGCGIAQENLARVFAHGFTTRAQGHGIGLHGAAVAAREMGGSLVARSDGVDAGATFVLELPLVRAAVDAGAEVLA